MDVKALKKLADACRKAGIKQYKCAEFEFTLADEGPISNYKKRTAPKASQALPAYQENIESDSLTQEALLMWSSGSYDESNQ